MGYSRILPTRDVHWLQRGSIGRRLHLNARSTAESGVVVGGMARSSHSEVTRDRMVICCCVPSFVDMYTEICGFGDFYIHISPVQMLHRCLLCASVRLQDDARITLTLPEVVSPAIKVDSE